MKKNLKAIGIDHCNRAVDSSIKGRMKRGQILDRYIASSKKQQISQPLPSDDTKLSIDIERSNEEIPGRMTKKLKFNLEYSSVKYPSSRSMQKKSLIPKIKDGLGVLKKIICAIFALLKTIM